MRSTMTQSFQTLYNVIFNGLRVEIKEEEINDCDGLSMLAPWQVLLLRGVA